MSILEKSKLLIEFLDNNPQLQFPNRNMYETAARILEKIDIHSEGLEKIVNEGFQQMPPDQQQRCISTSHSIG